eukprot:10365038-Alexandrium_andersonii.AAC.1
MGSGNRRRAGREVLGHPPSSVRGFGPRCASCAARRSLTRTALAPLFPGRTSRPAGRRLPRSLPYQATLKVLRWIGRLPAGPHPWCIARVGPSRTVQHGRPGSTRSLAIDAGGRRGVKSGPRSPHLCPSTRPTTPFGSWDRAR